ncbi:MAG: hypothetical protein L0H29_01005 [Sinobacteraceae bacterium]|nr:hypothetical protein [Nevskiaceae bacterium]
MCAARALLKAGASALLSWGTCGALDPRLVAGDLILPQTVCDDNGMHLVTDASWRAQLVAALPQRLQPASQACLLSGDRLVTTAEDKAASFNTAVAVDMESAALAREAQAAGLPFIAVRVVVDSARRRLPQLALDTVDDIGRPRAGAFLSAALKRPWQLLELPALGRDFRKATATLTAIAACASAALAFGAAGRAS